MTEVTNVKVYELDESIVACRNAMRTSPVSKNEYGQYDPKEWEDSLKRAKQLCKASSNSGHANFLTGIRVSFDIKYPQYLSPELQRYHWIDIVTSASKMHKLTAHIGKDSFNKYTDPRAIDLVKELIDEYNKDQSYENFMRVLSNCPLGLELFMRISTNYMQLRNLYHQRKNHKLKEDWGAVCKMIEELPFFEEFINYV